MFLGSVLSFDLTSMTKEQKEALQQAETALKAAGVYFDTNTSETKVEWDITFLEGNAQLDVFGVLNEPEDDHVCDDDCFDKTVN